jgi:hypothetical protein
MVQQENSREPLIEKKFNEDCDIQRYINEGGILGKIYLMMQSKPEFIESAFNRVIEPVRDELNIMLLGIKLHEVSRDVNFLGAMEIEFLARDLRKFIKMVMTYGPVRVDLIEPDRILLTMNHIQNIVADISEMHKTLMLHVASALKDDEKVLSPWERFDMEQAADSCEKDSGKISAIMFIELQHEDKPVLEKMVESKIAMIRGDKNINLIDIQNYGIGKTSEIVGYEDDDEEENKKEEEDEAFEEHEEDEGEFDFYSGVLEVKFEVSGIRKLLSTVLKYQASGIEILKTSDVTLSREQANLLLGDVIKTGQMLSEQLQMLLSDPKRRAMYEAALKESEDTCGTCRK